MKILVTGSAGFIGFFLARKLLERGDEVLGIDNINDYYNPALKYDRLRQSGIEKEHIIDSTACKSGKYLNYRFIKINLEDRAGLENIFKDEKFDAVCNIAAQAGVRYSIQNPYAYIDSNINGFMNILECCRHNRVNHLVFASSSSVYGLNEKIPFSTAHNVDHPISLYAASKKANELMAHTYSHLFNLHVTGLRFFTVYGPWGRPDMAYFKFTKAILNDEVIDVYNNGDMSRDFTYIDDIIEGVVRVIDSPPEGNKNWNGFEPDPGSSRAPYKIYNIGNSSPVSLFNFIGTIEKALGKKAKMNLLPMQPGDVPVTYADVTDLVENLNYRPDTSIEYGIGEFVKWYREYYGL